MSLPDLHMDKVAEEAASNVNNAKVETVTDANGLPCVISDQVPKDVFLTDLLRPLPLNDRTPLSR